VTLNHVVAADQRPAPLDERVAWVALTELALAEHGWIRMSPADRQAIEAALTTRYRDIVADGRLFQSGVERDPLAAERQAIARALLLRPPDPRCQTAGPIGTRLNDIVSRVSALDEVPWHQTFYERTFGLYGTAAILALILNFVFCGGFLRVMGLELLTADGRQASRLRVLVRTALTWSPILIAPLVMPFAERYMPDVAGTPWWALGMLIGAIAILLTPSRGLQDRIARTWVGPR
jgi:hypothetical protein